jgi:argininosuccinate lyase
MVREKKIPFRLAHRMVGRTVTEALQRGIKPGEIDSKFLDKISVEITGEALQLNDELVKKALDPYEVIKSRNVVGGPSPEVVEKDISKLRDFVESELT